jgi:DNA-binding NarL/FixJ family response regulator
MLNTDKSATGARIFVVDDHPIVREGLASHLTREVGLEVCGNADEVSEALSLITSSQPDLVILDITLKNGSGLDLLKRLKAHHPTLRVLIWSAYPDNLYAERALRAGAMGYIHKGRPADEIITAIRTVLAGKIYLSDEESARMISRLVGGDHQSMQHSAIEALTDRELEVFEHLGHGQTTQQIAQKMHVSPKTVETYRARIKEKLKLHNAMELIQRAVQWVMEQD